MANPRGPAFPPSPDGWGWPLQTQEEPIEGTPTNGQIVSTSVSIPNAVISFDGVESASGYRIYRSTSPAEIGSLLNSVDISQPGAAPWTFQYTDTTLAIDTVYWYRAVAVDAEGHISFPSTALRVIVSEVSSLLLDDIGNHLILAGIVGGSTGWTLQKSFLPSDPDKIIALFETGGESPGIISTGSVEPSYDKPTFQVIIRGAIQSYKECRQKAQEVFEALHANEPVSGVGEAVYVYVYAMTSGPLPMGNDTKERPRLSWNFRTMRER